MQWYTILAAYPDRITVKDFYDRFLVMIPVADLPNYANAFTWWQHAASRAARAGACKRSGLQVPTAQVLPMALCAAREG